MSPETRFIARRQTDSEFSELRALMLEQVQAMSGHLWTDYNIHDPGVTIIEQLCYGLTDINYRSAYSVKDFLVNGSNTVDLHQHGMFTPQEALPCRALTHIDYRKHLIDKFDELDYIVIKGARLENAPSDTQSVLSGCLYDIHIRQKSGRLGTQQSSENSCTYQSLTDKIREEFNKIRNIGEDLNDILFIEEQAVELIARIEIEAADAALDIISNVYYQVNQILSGTTNRYSINALEEGGEILSDLLTGPLMQSGYINEDDLDDGVEKIPMSRLVSRVKNITGVVRVKSLMIESARGEVFSDYLPASSEISHRLIIPGAVATPTSATSAPAAPESSTIKVEILIKGQPVDIDLLAFVDAYEMLDHNEFYRQKDLIEKPDGRFIPHERKNISTYTSVQVQFPDIYGINKAGVPASFATERKAQALQLTGYLMMSDHTAVLDNIKDLFSINLDARSSYKTQALNSDSIASINRLYVQTPHSEFLGENKNYEDFPDRKSRVFDYMLAMNGRDNELYGFEYRNPYFTQDELNAHVLKSKCANLKYVHEISANRGGAYNYTEPCWNQRNISAFEKYILNIIGVEVRCRSLVYPLIENGIKFSYESEAGSGLLRASKEIPVYTKTQLIEYFYKDIHVDVVAHQQGFKNVPYQKVSDESSFLFFDAVKKRLTDGDNTLSQAVLNNGVDLSRYRVGHINEDSSVDLLFSPDKISAQMNEWYYIASFVTEEDAFSAANQLRHSLIMLNLQMEGLHMIEHTLLLPVLETGCRKIEQLENETFYAHQISIVLPDWTSRFSDKNFRQYLENIIRCECPAHIHANIYWLNFSDMKTFEVIFKNWLNLRCGHHDFSKLNDRSNSLCDFLQSLNEPREDR